MKTTMKTVVILAFVASHWGDAQDVLTYDDLKFKVGPQEPVTEIL